MCCGKTTTDGHGTFSIGNHAVADNEGGLLHDGRMECEKYLGRLTAQLLLGTIAKRTLVTAKSGRHMRQTLQRDGGLRKACDVVPERSIIILAKMQAYDFGPNVIFCSCTN